MLLGHQGVAAAAGLGSAAFSASTLSQGVPRTFLVTSEAELLASFAPAGGPDPAAIGLEGFFGEVGVPVVPDKAPPDPVAPDPGDFARRAARYGIEIVACADARLTPPLALKGQNDGERSKSGAPRM